MNCLKAADVETLGDLVQFNKTDLLKFRNFGKKSLTELAGGTEAVGETETEEAPRTREFCMVDDDWFDDAAFYLTDDTEKLLTQYAQLDDFGRHTVAAFLYIKEDIICRSVKNSVCTFRLL